MSSTNWFPNLNIFAKQVPGFSAWRYPFSAPYEAPNMNWVESPKNEAFEVAKRRVATAKTAAFMVYIFGKLIFNRGSLKPILYANQSINKS